MITAEYVFVALILAVVVWRLYRTIESLANYLDYRFRKRRHRRKVLHETYIIYNAMN